MKYNDLSRILEEEKKSTLSRINPEFYKQVRDYINELETADQQISRRHSEEAVMIQDELKNALAAVDKIFNKRTRKIMKMALIKAFSKDPSNIAHDTDHMTPEENEIYHQVLKAVLNGKKKTIEPILGNDREPSMVEADISPPEPGPTAGEMAAPQEEPAARVTVEPEPPAKDAGENIRSAPASDKAPPPEPTDIILDRASDITELTADTVMDDVMDDEGALPARPADNVPVEADVPSKAEHGKKDLSKEYILVRILKDISTFAGSDGRNYTLNAEDLAVLPKVNARALIKRNIAVPIKNA